MTFTLADLDALLAKVTPPPGPRATTIHMHPTAWIVIKATVEERPLWRGLGDVWGLPVIEDDGLPFLGWEGRDQDGNVMASGSLMPPLPPWSPDEMSGTRSFVSPWSMTSSITLP